MIESTLLRHFGEYRSWKMTQCHVHCKLSRVKTIPDNTRSEVQTKTPKFFYSPFFWNLNNLVLRKDPFYIKKNIEERTAFDGMRNLSYFIHNFKFSEFATKTWISKTHPFSFWQYLCVWSNFFKRLLEHYHIATNAKTTILKNCLIPINIQL